MNKNIDRRALQSCLFQLTALVNAVRFFNGTAVPDFEGDGKKISQYANYCRECLRPELRDAWSPLQEDGSIGLFDADGEMLTKVNHETAMSVSFSDDFIATWWELIQDYVKGKDHDEYRLSLLSSYYSDHVMQIMQITARANRVGRRLRISPSTIAAVRAAQEQA